jgi:glutamate-1-semialdehyde 2,1-aminomutase
MAAGIATLEKIGEPGFYEALDAAAGRLLNGLTAEAENAGVEVTADRVGSMMGLYFSVGPVSNFEEAKKSNLDQFSHYYNAMRDRGIYLAPSQFEAAFVSAAHDSIAIDKTLAAAKSVFEEMAG